jgi:hypothetical protein
MYIFNQGDSSGRKNASNDTKQERSNDALSVKTIYDTEREKDGSAPNTHINDEPVPGSRMTCRHTIVPPRLLSLYRHASSSAFRAPLPLIAPPK